MSNEYVGETDIEWHSARKNSAHSRHKFCIEDEEDPKARQIRILAKIQIVLGLIALTISAVMWACLPHGTGSSTGTWCTIYIMMFSIMCLGRGELMRAKFAVIFGVIGMKFAVLMIILEIIEVRVSFGLVRLDYASVSLHITLGIIGLLELISLILTVIFHTSQRQTDVASEVSKDEVSSRDLHIIRNSDGAHEQTKEDSKPLDT